MATRAMKAAASGSPRHRAATSICRTAAMRPTQGNAVAMAAKIMAIAYAPTAPRMTMASIMTPTIMRGDNSG